MTGGLYIALLHRPVYDKGGRIVTTAVANMDIHDIARTAKTFGVTRYYIVTPVPSQQALVRQILGHWQEGYGATYNPSRREALELVSLQDNLDAVLRDVAALAGLPARLVGTGAGLQGNTLSCKELQKEMQTGPHPWLLLFGTGWGLAEEVIKQADFLLEPIRGPVPYNHLPVRAAVAIYLDRLRGQQINSIEDTGGIGQ